MQDRSGYLWKGPYNLVAPLAESTSSSNTNDPYRMVAPVTESTSSSNTNAQLPKGAKVYHRSTNISDASACVLRQLQSSVQYRASTQKPLRKKLSKSNTSLQPFRLLDLPLEIRLMIYELIVGGGQRIHIQSDLEWMGGVSVGQYSDGRRIKSDDLEEMRGSFSVYRSVPDPMFDDPDFLVDYGPVYDNQSASVSYGLRTRKQQVGTKGATSISPPALGEGNPSPDWVLNMRLLQTCRRVYDEARLVLYHSNTFVFLSFAAFATYLGLGALDQVEGPRSTEPNRLRAIQAMTQVELQGKCNPFNPSFLWSTRIIRKGLGCLTSLRSLEVNLEAEDMVVDRSRWEIDDCMFSKPPSLRKLVVHMRNPDRYVSDDESPFATVKDNMKAAEELVRRMLNEEGFSDLVEPFLHSDKTAASTRPSVN